MNRIKTIFTISLAALASPALAQDADRNVGSGDRPFYSGTSIIFVDPNLENLDSAFGLSQTAGIRIPGVEWFAVELDLGLAFLGGENSGAASPFSGGGGGGGGGGLLPGGGGGDNGGGNDRPNSTTSSNDFQAFTYGVFAALRTPGRFFAGTRLGYSGMNTNIPELDENSDGFTYTFQVGYRWSEATHNLVQLEYFEYENEAEHFGLTANYAFD